jgi:hypothetical protein
VTAGPFLVTLRTPAIVDGIDPNVVSVRAVATLDEALKVAQWPIGGLHEDWEVARAQVLMIGPEGGSVSLPDGSTVEVEKTSWPWIGGQVVGGAYLPEPRLLDAFNEKHAGEGKR